MDVQNFLPFNGSYEEFIQYIGIGKTSKRKCMLKKPRGRKPKTFYYDKIDNWFIYIHHNNLNKNKEDEFDMICQLDISGWIQYYMNSEHENKYEMFLLKGARKNKIKNGKT